MTSAIAFKNAAESKEKKKAKMSIDKATETIKEEESIEERVCRFEAIEDRIKAIEQKI